MQGTTNALRSLMAVLCGRRSSAAAPAVGADAADRVAGGCRTSSTRPWRGSYVGRIVFAGLCDKLFDIDEKLQIVPQLALGYEWTDPKTLVIHLRPNVTFHDGEPFDADGGEIQSGAPSDPARQFPPRGDQHDRPCGGRRSADRAAGAEIAVVAAAGAADRPLRDDRCAQGRRGRGQGFRPASGLQRPVQVHRAGGAGPDRAGSLSRDTGMRRTSISTG